VPKIDFDAIPENNSTGYPEPYAGAVVGRWKRKPRPTDALDDFGVNLVRLEPGAWSSQRHVHEADDEFLVMLEGEAVLIEDEGRTLLGPGDCAAFPKGGTAHHLVNESDTPCRFVALGANKGGAAYPDIDLEIRARESFYRHKDGRPY
jgi:uncharacterized cupin superfamily protein